MEGTDAPQFASHKLIESGGFGGESIDINIFFIHFSFYSDIHLQTA